MISFKMYWWYVPIILFIIPIIREVFYHGSGNWWDFDFNGFLLFCICWIVAIAIIITKLLS